MTDKRKLTLHDRAVRFAALTTDIKELESEKMRLQNRLDALIREHDGHRSVLGETVGQNQTQKYFPLDATSAVVVTYRSAMRPSVEEHAANGDVYVLSERIDSCSEQVAQLHNELREAGVLAMTDAVRRGETGDSIENEARLVADLAVKIGIADSCCCVDADVKSAIGYLKVARVAVRKERENV